MSKKYVAVGVLNPVFLFLQFEIIIILAIHSGRTPREGQQSTKFPKK